MITSREEKESETYPTWLASFKTPSRIELVSVVTAVAIGVISGCGVVIEQTDGKMAGKKCFEKHHDIAI